jgi:hypothetical protein
MAEPSFSFLSKFLLAPLRQSRGWISMGLTLIAERNWPQKYLHLCNLDLVLDEDRRTTHAPISLACWTSALECDVDDHVRLPTQP